MEEVRPPYLFGRAGDDGSPVSFRSAPGAAVVEMAVHGHWTRRLGIQTSTGLRKCLAEQPGAVIADLRALSDPHGLSVSLWFAVRRTAVALDPPVEVVLCTLPGTQLTERLRRLGARRF